MPDEPRPEDEGAEDFDQDLMTTEGEGGPGEGAPPKLPQKVETIDVGPCRKHVKVTVDRSAIEHMLKDKYGELVKNANVPGFRPGKAPMRIVQKRFKSDVS